MLQQTGGRQVGRKSETNKNEENFFNSELLKLLIILAPTISETEFLLNKAERGSLCAEIRSQMRKAALRSCVIISNGGYFEECDVAIRAIQLVRGSAIILPNNQHLHFLKENFVLLVSSPSFHLVIQLGDDLVLKLQLDIADTNNHCG